MPVHGSSPFLTKYSHVRIQTLNEYFANILNDCGKRTNSKVNRCDQDQFAIFFGSGWINFNRINEDYLEFLYDTSRSFEASIVKETTWPRY